MKFYFDISNKINAVNYKINETPKTSNLTNASGNIV